MLDIEIYNMNRFGEVSSEQVTENTEKSIRFSKRTVKHQNGDNLSNFVKYELTNSR